MKPSLSLITVLIIITSLDASSSQDLDLGKLRTAEVRQMFAAAKPANLDSLDIGTSRKCRFYPVFEFDENDRLVPPGHIDITLIYSKQRTTTGKPSPTGIVELHNVCATTSLVVGSPVLVSSEEIYSLNFRNKPFDYFRILTNKTLIIEAGLNPYSGIKPISNTSEWASYYMICPPSGKQDVCADF